MMTGNRLLAFFVAACALAASALIALPMDSPQIPADQFSLASAYAVPVPPPSGRAPLAAARETPEEVHTAVPRLWLGGR
jgi:hypothetical protein